MRLAPVAVLAMSVSPDNRVSRPVTSAFQRLCFSLFTDVWQFLIRLIRVHPW